MPARRKNLWGVGETHKRYTRAPGGKFHDVSEHGSVKQARAASLAEARREKAERAAEAKRRAAEKRKADALNRQYLAQQEREERQAEQRADREERAESKRQAQEDRKEEAATRKLEAEHQKRWEKAKSKEQKLAEALQRKYEAARKKAAAVPAKRRVSDKSILAELMRDNPKLAAWAKRNPAQLAKLAKRRNPADQAAEGFKEFHGHDSTEVVTVTQKIHQHKHLAAAGELRKLDIWGIDEQGHRLTQFKGALLCFNEKKTQLFVRGGDQSVNLENFGIEKPHELETLGELVGIDYFTNKTHLGNEGGEAVYQHELRTTNENGKHVVVEIARYPDVVYRVLDEQIEFSGGSYFIRAEGIDQ